LPIEGWRNWVELPHVICPGEFDFKPTASTIVANAANLNILHRLTFDVQWLGAVDTVTDPLPTAGAPVEVRIEVARHHAGSMRVFSRISRRQFGHFAGASRM
jgi:hypothetical protein